MVKTGFKSALMAAVFAPAAALAQNASPQIQNPPTISKKPPSISRYVEPAPAEPDANTQQLQDIGKRLFGQPSGRDQAMRDLESMLANVPPRSDSAATLRFMRYRSWKWTGDDAAAADELKKLIDAFPERKDILREGIDAFAYSPDVVVAAKSWLLLSYVDPEEALAIDDYTLTNIQDRTVTNGRQGLALAMAGRLEKLGYQGGSAYAMSKIAQRNFAAQYARGNKQEAIKYLGRIGDPQVLEAFYTDRKFKDYWPAIESRMPISSMYESYTKQLERDYQATGDLFTLSAMLRTMNQAGWSAEIVEKYLSPLENQMKNGRRGNVDYSFLVPSIAEALVRIGREEDGIALFENAYAVWGSANSSLRANISANFARFLIDNDRPEQALEYIDNALSAISGNMDADEISTFRIKSVKIQILDALGRKDEANALLQSIERQQYQIPNVLAMIYFERGQYETGRDILIAEIIRDQGGYGLAWVQPDNRPVFSAREEQTRAIKAKLLADPKYRKVFDKYGRLLGEQWNPPYERIAE